MIGLFVSGLICLIDIVIIECKFNDIFLIFYYSFGMLVLLIGVLFVLVVNVVDVGKWFDSKIVELE